MSKLVLGLLCTAVLAAPAAAAPAKGKPAVARLHALFDQEWERELREEPLAATAVGDHRYDDRWPDRSPAAREASHRADLAVLDKLKGIPRAALPASEQLNYDLFKRQYEQRTLAWPFKYWVYRITAREGPQSLNEVAEDMPFDTAAQYRLWLIRLERLPAYLDQYAASRMPSEIRLRNAPARSSAARSFRRIAALTSSSATNTCRRRALRSASTTRRTAAPSTPTGCGSTPPPTSRPRRSTSWA